MVAVRELCPLFSIVQHTAEWGKWTQLGPLGQPESELFGMVQVERVAASSTHAATLSSEVHSATPRAVAAYPFTLSLWLPNSSDAIVVDC